MAQAITDQLSLHINSFLIICILPGALWLTSNALTSQSTKNCWFLPNSAFFFFLYLCLDSLPGTILTGYWSNEHYFEPIVIKHIHSLQKGIPHHRTIREISLQYSVTAAESWPSHLCTLALFLWMCVLKQAFGNQHTLESRARKTFQGSNFGSIFVIYQFLLFDSFKHLCNDFQSFSQSPLHFSSLVQGKGI